MKQMFMLPPHSSADRHTVLMFEITRLPALQRDVLLLFYYERLTLDEIATVLEASEEDVAAQFYRAHEQLGMISAPPEVLENAGVG